MKVLVVGRGGHAKVVKDVIESMQGIEAIQCSIEDVISDDKQNNGTNQPIISQIYSGEIRHVIVGIGDNKRRMETAKYLQVKYCLELFNAIGHNTYISPSAKLGKGIVVVHGAVINPYAVIADNVIINTRASIDHDSIVGEGSHIAPGCSVAGCVCIGKGVFLGIGSSVKDNTSIGDWTIVGAGAAVVKPLPEYVTAVGVPAKPIKINKI